GAARAAMVPLGAIRLKRSFGEDRTKEQPGTVLPTDEIGVLSLPANSGSFRQRFFRTRCGVYEALHVRPGPRSEFLRKLLELALDDVVVITVPGIDGNVCPVLASQQFGRIAFRPVIHPEHDDRAHLWPEDARVAAALLRFRHPLHRGVPSLGDKFVQPLRRQRYGIRRCDGYRIETKLSCFGVEESPKPV